MKDIRQNYLQIQGWMVQDLNLKGNDLLAFGLIFGFCQDDSSEFTGSIDYLSTWLNTSRPTTMKALSNLCAQNLIIKRIEIINNVQFNRYKINLPVVKNLYGGSKESLLGGVKNLYGGSKETLRGGSKETLPNSTILNNTTNTLTNSEDSEFSKNENPYPSQEVIDIIPKKEEEEKAPQTGGAAEIKVWGEWKDGQGNGELHELLKEYFLNPNSPRYEAEEYRKFKAYWTAKVLNGKDRGKELWRIQKTFSISGRLSTWNQKSTQFNQNKQNGTTGTNPRHKDNWNAEDVARDAIALATAHLR